MKIHSFIFSVCIAFTAHCSYWTGIDYFPGYNYFQVSQTNDEVCSFVFPLITQTNAHYPAFLLLTNGVLASLSNYTIECRFRVDASSDAVFRYGGQGSFWNKGPLPAHTRLFFSTVTGYSNTGPATNYWFNSHWHKIDATTGTATLSAVLKYSDGWTDGQGHSDSNAFVYATGNVKQIGLCYGGGSFYDIGLTLDSGTASFHLLSFTATKPINFTVDVNEPCRFFQRRQDGVVYTTTNLLDWEATSL